MPPPPASTTTPSSSVGGGNVRDRLLLQLCLRGVGYRRMQTIQLVDVIQDPEADFLESRPLLKVLRGKRMLPVDATLRESIEDYVNADH